MLIVIADLQSTGTVPLACRALNTEYIKICRALNTGTVPLAWKWSNVTPVYKGGDTENPGNFHPISVVTVVAKVLEKMIADQL